MLRQPSMIHEAGNHDASCGIIFGLVIAYCVA